MRAPTLRRSRGLCAVAAAAVALVVALPGVAAAGGPTGNGTAIRLYRAASKVMNHLSAYEIHQRGYVRIYTSIGRHRATSWAWGQDQFQKGEVPTIETIVLVQRAGNVIYIEDTLRPQKTCGEGGVCPTILPLQLVITAKEAFAGIVSSGSTAACFTKEPLFDVPYAAGASWWFAIGSFAKPVVKGHLIGLTTTYPDSGQMQTEIDWVSNSSHRFTRSAFRLSKTKKHRAFAFFASYKVLSGRPKQPKINPCS